MVQCKLKSDFQFNIFYIYSPDSVVLSLSDFFHSPLWAVFHRVETPTTLVIVFNQRAAPFDSCWGLARVLLIQVSFTPPTLSKLLMNSTPP